MCSSPALPAPPAGNMRARRACYVPAMHALRLVPALFLFLSVQLGLHRALCAIFFPLPAQVRARRRLGWLLGALTLFLPLQIATMRLGGQEPAALREAIVEPVLAWLVISLPLLGLLSLLRWPLGPRGRVAAGELDPAVDGLHANENALHVNQNDLSTKESAPAPPPILHAPPGGRRLLLVRGSQALLGGAAVLVARGVREAESAPQITRREIFLRDLHPDLDGLTVLQLSDIHSGALVTEERMRGFAAEAAALDADLIVFTGDLLDGSGRAAAPYTRAFERLHGRLGTVAILGNHDYYAGERFAIRAARDAGQALLRNSGMRIARGQGSLWLGGVDDPLGAAAGGAVDPIAALRGAAPEEAKLLLAHRPGLFEECAAAGADLVLSGHTHGGQLALSRVLTPARLLGKHTMGHYVEGKTQLYVHRGMGVVGAAPLRLGAPPELALLTLRRV